MKTESCKLRGTMYARWHVCGGEATHEQASDAHNLHASLDGGIQIKVAAVSGAKRGRTDDDKALNFYSQPVALSDDVTDKALQMSF